MGAHFAFRFPFWRSKRFLPARLQGRRGAPPLRPELEALEDRLNLSVPVVTQALSGTGVAITAYNGAPFTGSEQDLLANSADLVIHESPGAAQLQQLNAVAPATPQLLYTNFSSLYLDTNAQNADADTLSSWLQFADAHGYDREAAFYHLTATAASPAPATFSIPTAAPSSEAVQWFTGVYAGPSSATTGLTDDTLPAHTVGGSGVAFGGTGSALYIGYTERFNQITVTLGQAPQNSWAYTLQYASLNAQGQLTWATLPTNSDTTNGLTQTGTIQFDPPAGWAATTLTGRNDINPPYGYYVRVLTTSAGGTPPTAATIEGYNYVGGNGQTQGTIPVWDAAADTDNNGYLNNAEWQAAAAALNLPLAEVARFAYQSRIIYNIPDPNTAANTITGSYGEMRFATNPANSNFRQWAISYDQSLLAANPIAAGLYMDNSGAVSPVSTVAVGEQGTTSYSSDYATLLGAIDQAIGPDWILPNVAGGGAAADGVVAATGAYFYEGAIDPLVSSWSGFEKTIAAQVAAYSSVTASPPYAVLSSNPENVTTGLTLPADPRAELASLAEYDLLADPASTLLDLNAAASRVKAASWTRQWTGAEAFNLGQPSGSFSLLTSGPDPESPSNYTYRVYQRDYSNALVLYKPLSYDSTTGNVGTTDDSTATTISLNGTYYYLNADGTLQRDQNGNPLAVTSVTLRNGEGAILVKALGASDTFAPNTLISNRTLGKNPWTVQTGSNGFTVNNGFAGQPAYNGVAVGNNGTAGQVNIATVSGLSLQDVQVEADVTVVPNYTASLLARYQGPGDASYYAGGLYRDGSGHYYYFIAKASSSGIWSYPLALTAVTLSPGTHHVTFSVSDASGGGVLLTLYIDGAEYGPVIDKTNPITAAGQVGIRGRDAATFDNFVATDLGTVGGNAPYTIAFSDGFTQAGPLGSSAPWAVTAGSFVFPTGTASGPIQGGSSLNMAAAFTGSMTDTAVQADVTLDSGGDVAGLLARYNGSADSSATFYEGFLTVNSSGSYEAGIREKFAGAWQGDGTVVPLPWSAALGTPHHLEFEVLGGGADVVLRLYVDGVLAVATTDTTTIITSGQAGIRSFNGDTLDNFQATALTDSSAPLPQAATFPQADGAPLDPQTWIVTAGGFKVRAGQAAAIGTASVTDPTLGASQAISLATLYGVSAADVTVQADVTVGGDADGVALVTRYTEDNNGKPSYYAGALWVDSQGAAYAEVWKVVSGTLSFVGTPVFLGEAASLGQTRLSFEVFGATTATLELFVDGVLRQEVNDSSGVLGAGTAGVRAGAAGDRFDNFTFSATAPLASDTFSQPDGSSLNSTLWTAAAGQFKVLGGSATVGSSGSAPAIATVTGLTLSDTVVAADVTLGSPNADAELLARYTGINGGGHGDSNYYAGGIYRDPSNNYYAYVELVNNGGVPTYLSSPHLVPLTLLPGVVSHHLQFEVVSMVVGSRTEVTLTLYVDGVLAAFGTDGNGTYASGSVGIRANTANGAAFDNFEVTGVEPFFSDPFTRAGGSLGSSWVAANTQAGGQGFSVSSDEAVGAIPPVGTPPDLAVVAGAAVTDVSVQASVVLTGPGHTAGVVARYQTTGSYYAGVLAYDSGAGQYFAEIEVVVNGTPTEQARAANGLGSISGLHRLRLEVLGNALALYVDGVLQVHIGDTTISTPGAVGMLDSGGDDLKDFSASWVGEPFNAVTAANTPAFSDTFNGATLGGSWAVASTGNSVGVSAGQAVIGTTRGVGVGMAGVPSTAGLVNVVVEADVTVAANNQSATLLARYNGAPDASASFYSGSLYRDNSGVYWAVIKKKYNGAWANSSNSLWAGSGSVGVQVPLSAGTAPYHLRFEVIGNTLSLYVNGVLVVSTTDPDPTSPSGGKAAYLSSGQVGIRGYSNNTFDNFQVTVVAPLAGDAFRYSGPLGPVWNAAGNNAFTAGSGLAVGQPAGGALDVATVANVALADVSVAAGVKLAAPGDEAGVLARAQGGPGGLDYYAGVLYRDSSGNYYAQIWLHEGSNATLLGQSASLGNLVGNTDTVRLEVVGQTLALYVDGTLRIQVTDDTLTGPGAVGMLADAGDALSAFTAAPV